MDVDLGRHAELDRLEGLMAVALARLGQSVVAFDEVVAARHRSEFARLVEDPGLRDRVVADVVGRRAGHAGRSDRSSMLVAVDEIEGIDGGRALIARGEVLVSRPTVEVVQLLADGGFACVGRVGAVLRYRKRDADAAAVRATCHELLWRGASASPNYVIYAGGRIKARLGLLEPLPTSVRPAGSRVPEPSGTTARVAVLDTATAGRNGDTGHGGFVTGLVRQLAPGCELDVHGVLASDGLGTDFSVAQGLHRLAASAAAVPVVNLSLYCAPVDGMVPVAMATALDLLAARRPETAIVAAAGNDGSSRPSWPAAHPFVVAVGAVSGKGPAAFSNRGSWVDFSARADGVVSNGVAWTGTSFAAAQLSGVLAALIGQGLNRDEVLSALTTAGVPSKECGVTFCSA